MSENRISIQFSEADKTEINAAIQTLLTKFLRDAEDGEIFLAA